MVDRTANQNMTIGNHNAKELASKKNIKRGTLEILQKLININYVKEIYFRKEANENFKQSAP